MQAIKRTSVYREFKMKSTTPDARILYVGNDDLLEINLVWRLEAKTAEGRHYHLGFWFETRGDGCVTRFADSTSDAEGRPGLRIEGVQDESLNKSFGSFQAACCKELPGITEMAEDTAIRLGELLSNKHSWAVD
jgi:hypothetical protein